MAATALERLVSFNVGCAFSSHSQDMVPAAMVPVEQEPITPAATIAPAGALVADSVLGVRLRPWGRKDRSELASWPAPSSPFTGIFSMVRPAGGPGPRVSWAVVDLMEPERLVGRLSLRDITATQARIGIYLREDAQGQGNGSTALDLFTQQLMPRIGLDRLVLDVAAANVPAVRCYRRCGFTELAREWRAVNDPATALLALPEHRHMLPYFAHGEGGAVLAEFIEMAYEPGS